MTQNLGEEIDSLCKSAPSDRDALNSEMHRSICSRIEEVLGHPGYLQLPLGRQFEFLDFIERIFANTRNDCAAKVAPLVASVFRAHLEGGEADLFRQIRTHDLLFLLYWCAARNIEEMRPLNDRVMVPFAGYLREYAAKNKLRERRFASRRKKMRLCYLSQFCFFGTGNGIADAMYSLLRNHVEECRGDSSLYLYSFMYNSEEFLQKVRDLGVIVRCFHVHEKRENLEVLRESFFRDDIDAVVTDMNSGVPSYLFESRVAPVQAFLQFGLPFWGICNLDAAFFAWHMDPGLAGHDSARSHHVRFRPYSHYLDEEPNPEKIASERGKFPPARRVVGIYGRLAKVSEAYLEAMGAILRAHADVIGILAGTGDARVIRDFADRNGLGDRLFVAGEFVDPNVYCGLIDIMLDTFPSMAGVSAAEMMARGRPIVHMESREMPNSNTRLRDPELLARTPDEFVAHAGRLIRDAGEYDKAGRRARDLFARLQQTEKPARKIEGVLREILAQKAGADGSRSGRFWEWLGRGWRRFWGHVHPRGG